MADKRAGSIFATAFVGGLLVTAAIFSPRAWEPVPEPFFGLDESVPVAAPLPQQQPAPSLPAPSASADDLEAMAAAMQARARTAQRPERLAMNAPSTAAGQSAAPAVVPIQPPPAPPAPAAPESLKSLVTRVQMRRGSEGDATPPARIDPLPETAALGPAPLPGTEWSDPDSVNWSDAPHRAESQRAPRTATPGRAADDHAAAAGRLRERLRQADGPAARVGDRLLARGRRDGDRGESRDPALAVPARAPESVWPEPAALLDQLHRVASAPHGDDPACMAACGWAEETIAVVGQVIATQGPHDAAAATALISLGDAVHAGMEAADRIRDQATSSLARRAALAVARRAAVWRAAVGLFTSPQPAATATSSPALAAGAAQLLTALERFEATAAPAEAAAVRECLRVIDGSGGPAGATLTRTVGEHYLAPNVRVAVHQQFLDKLLPEAQVRTGPVDEIIAGRQVRGTRTVTRTTTVKFLPDPDEIAFHLEVHGDISSRSVTDAGPVSLTSRGSATFVVQKPVKVSAQGLLFGPATGVASNRSRLDGIQTSFDSVPVMRSLVRQIAKSQHEDSMPDVNREVIDKIIAKACRETDQQAEPQFADVAERIRTKVWTPLVKLGLEPTPVALETTQTVATARLRLAGDAHLAAHTPRPRAPTDALLSMQFHDSSLNNAFDRLGLAGQRLTLEDLITQLCSRLGLEPKLPEDLPEGVEVTFAQSQPLRVECRDGRVNVRVALDALESGRRNWYDLVVQVAYRPTVAGPQVYLEREGPVQIGGPGHQGRMEIALRTIFGKIFPKERPIAVLPERITKNPRLASMHAVQAVSSDGWFGLALASREPAKTVAAPKPTSPEARRPAIFR